MSRLALIALLFTLLPPGTAASAPVSAARPVRLTPAEADSLTRTILKDRADTEQWLKSGATSYLATVQRVDFGAKRTLTVGRAPDNDVVIADPGVSPHHLSVSVTGDSFQVAAVDPGVAFRHKENPRPDTTIILSTRGNRRRAVRVGWFDFLVGKTPCRLEATRLLEPGVGENDISVFFRDATTGKESYATGRYVDPVKQPDGRYLLDLNLCYNPTCAISEHYNCPIPPRANALKVAIRAGEMDSHYH
jgi:uncharacterized protein (DUF1684 family)